jgi:hypothetical protein
VVILGLILLVKIYVNVLDTISIIGTNLNINVTTKTKEMNKVENNIRKTMDKTEIIYQCKWCDEIWPKHEIEKFGVHECCPNCMSIDLGIITKPIIMQTCQQQNQ